VCGKVEELWRKGFVEKMSFEPGVEERRSNGWWQWWCPVSMQCLTINISSLWNKVRRAGHCKSLLTVTQFTTQTDFIITGPYLPLPAMVLQRHCQPDYFFFHCRWCLRDGKLSQCLLTWLGLYDDGCAADTAWDIYPYGLARIWRSLLTLLWLWSALQVVAQVKISKMLFNV